MVKSVSLYVTQLHSILNSVCLSFQCQRLLKLRSVMMTPQNFTAVEPIKFISVTLSPSDEVGLVS